MTPEHRNTPQDPQQRDAAALATRPPYWEGCRAKSFGELRCFVEEALKSLPEPDPDADVPRTKDEFLDLLEMLCAKAEGRRAAEAPESRRKHEPPAFPRQGELDALEGKQDRLLEVLEELRDRPSTTKKQLGKLKKQMRANCGEIDELRAERRRFGRENQESYPWSHYIEYLFGEPRRNGVPTGDDTRARVLKRVERQIERAFDGDGAPETHRLDFVTIPRGESNASGLLGLLGGPRREQKDRDRYEERIVKAYSLGPEPVHLGVNEFEGYVVFEFPHTEKVLLEHPLSGNAIYVIEEDWRNRARLTKQELQADEKVTRIVHQGDWFGRLKEALGI